MSFLDRIYTGWNMKFLLFGFGKLGERKCVCAHVRVPVHIAM